MRPLYRRAGTPLTSRQFYVLLSLSSDDRTASEILDDVSMSSAGRLQISAATLGMSLRRLTDAGLVTRHNERFRLTHEGRLHLVDELERMERAVRFARSKRLGPKGA